MEKAFEAVKNLFPPPFVSRLDDIIVFRSLTKANLEQIAGSR
jgi:ATP-dependent Clp protease ATP-binding subunit ClpA